MSQSASHVRMLQFMGKLLRQLIAGNVGLDEESEGPVAEPVAGAAGDKQVPKKPLMKSSPACTCLLRELSAQSSPRSNRTVLYGKDLRTCQQGDHLRLAQVEGDGR